MICLKPGKFYKLSGSFIAEKLLLTTNKRMNVKESHASAGFLYKDTVFLLLEVFDIDDVYLTHGIKVITNSGIVGWKFLSTEMINNHMIFEVTE